jgi:hypothetical protein
MESPHILNGSFRANENGCRVSRGIDGKCCGGKKARARSLQEEGDGKERVAKAESGADQKGTGKGSRGE